MKMQCIDFFPYVFVYNKRAVIWFVLFVPTFKWTLCFIASYIIFFPSVRSGFFCWSYSIHRSDRMCSNLNKSRCAHKERAKTSIFTSSCQKATLQACKVRFKDVIFTKKRLFVLISGYRYRLRSQNICVDKSSPLFNVLLNKYTIRSLLFDSFFFLLFIRSKIVFHQQCTMLVHCEFRDSIKIRSISMSKTTKHVCNKQKNICTSEWE